MQFNDKINSFTLPYLRVGVLSDSQLPSGKNDGVFTKNLRDSMQLLAEKQCNVVLFGGDICNHGSKGGYNRYTDSYKQAFGEDMPIVQSIMGNHDYYRLSSAKGSRALFTAMTGEQPFSHNIINGYHFIACSITNAFMKSTYRDSKQWLIKHLNLAVADGGSRAVFVLTHNAQSGSCYGSNEWGDKVLGDILKNYPMVVNFSGHSHYSLCDERSLHQQWYTSINTQATAYIELDSGYENGSIPPNADKYPACMVMDIDEKITIARYDVASKREIKSRNRWELPTNLTTSSFTYANPSETAPVMTGSLGWKAKGKQTVLVFDRPQCSDIVHHYLVTFNGKLKQKYFSDFYCVGNQPNTIELPLVNVNRGKYSVAIASVDSYGNQSNCLTCNNVEVKDKVRYDVKSEITMRVGNY